jgi:hypothetical protein
MKTPKVHIFTAEINFPWVLDDISSPKNACLAIFTASVPTFRFSFHLRMDKFCCQVRPSPRNCHHGHTIWALLLATPLSTPTFDENAHLLMAYLFYVYQVWHLDGFLIVELRRFFLQSYSTRIEALNFCPNSSFCSLSWKHCSPL